MVRTEPSDFGVDQAFNRFLRLQDEGFPERELADLLCECVEQGEGFCKEVGLRISVATNLPISVVDEIDRVLRRKRAGRAR